MTDPFPESPMQRILVCDDDAFLRQAVRAHLEAAGFLVEEAQSGAACLRMLETSAPDLVLLDLQMPEMSGLETLRAMHRRQIDVPVIVMTAYGERDSAKTATQLGARAYLSKPLSFEELLMQMQRLFSDELDSEDRAEDEDPRYATLVGRSMAMREVFRALKRLESARTSTVLLYGESGTGKDLVAQALHSMGKRANAPYMEIDCAALPENLMESELFGYEKGAFTDARQPKPGLLELAQEGTVFLDEIGEMPLPMQAKLLRALESRRFKRVGGTTMRQMNAAIIAATNRDLADEVREGRFREDLYFRLNVIPITIPPLRERHGDIPLLVQYFLSRFNEQLDTPIDGIAPEAMHILEQYGWPGNVRELRNVVERVVMLRADTRVVHPSDLPPEIRFAAPAAEHADQPAGMTVNTTGRWPFLLPPGGIDIAEVETGFIEQALERSSGSIPKAAKLIGMSRHALRYRMQKMGLLLNGAGNDD